MGVSGTHDPRSVELLMAWHWAFLSIGSNLGDPVANCRQGIALLDAHDQIELITVSPFYWTQPVDYLDQKWFLNAAIKIRTSLEPLSLLAELQRIQTSLGRQDGGIRFGPRMLDLDIIFYEDRVMQTTQLILPHPRMHKRRFVLQPICDIDPSVVHPVLTENVDNLLKKLDPDNQKMRPCSFESSCC